MKKYTKDKNESIRFRLDKELKNKFILFCSKNELNYSERLRFLIEKDLKNWDLNLKKI